MVDKKHAKPIYNLKPALELISTWEFELMKDTLENTELVRFQMDEMSKLRKNMSYNMQFHERILRIMCESRVFMYPDLLPATPFRFKTSKASEYIPAEDLYVLVTVFVEFYIRLIYFK